MSQTAGTVGRLGDGPAHITTASTVPAGSAEPAIARGVLGPWSEGHTDGLSAAVACWTRQQGPLQNAVLDQSRPVRAMPTR